MNAIPSGADDDKAAIETPVNPKGSRSPRIRKLAHYASPTFAPLPPCRVVAALPQPSGVREHAVNDGTRNGSRGWRRNSFKGTEGRRLYDQAFAHVAAYFMPFLLRPPVLRQVCASLTLPRVRDSPLRRRSPPSARLATSQPPTSRRRWLQRRASAAACRRTLHSRSRTDRCFHSPTGISMRSSAISGLMFFADPVQA